MKKMCRIYHNGEYFKNNPTWHAEDSLWKTGQIIKIIDANRLHPDTVCEVGCGAGEILNQLFLRMSDNILFYGYEISSQAFELTRSRKKNRLKFFLRDITEDTEAFYDLVLLIDVFEHVEDCFGFLRAIRQKGEYKIFHIPLDFHLQNVLRKTFLMNARKKFGHIHYFTKETALAILEETGYEIIDYSYTQPMIELKNRGFRSGLLKFPRKILFSLDKDLAARILGGFGLLVLAK